MLYALGSAVILGAVMTFGDFLWAAFDIRHRAVNGVIHGAVMCLCLGAAIGIREGRLVAGILAGPLVGVLAACSFYLMAPSWRMLAMFPAWMVFWICFAFLQAWMAGERTWGPAAARGLGAAVLSGVAFYLISGIWTSHGTPNYAWNLAAWSFAFFPGFAVLFGASGARR